MAKRGSAVLAALLILIASGRIVSTYTALTHTVDEPDHLGTGMQWLAGEYTWDNSHPPLARVMAAVGVYAGGGRMVPASGGYTEGLLLLGRDDHYDHALFMARLGVLPLFWLAAGTVFLWARRTAGDAAAVIAVFLFTTIPPVLAHAGLVTTDMACTAIGAVTFVTSVWWSERPDKWRTAAFGILLGLSALAKFSLLVYLPAAWIAVLAGRRPAISTARRYLPALAAASLIGAVVICAGYRFTYLSEFFLGLKELMRHNSVGHASYILGRRIQIGVWYFFPVVLGVKTPLAMLGLVGWSAWYAWRKRLPVAIPAAFAAAVMAVAMAGHINIGVRHVLLIYTALAVLVGAAAADAMRNSRTATAALLALMVWQAISGAAAHPDYLAYTNEVAGDHPERIVAESDLDWGQDMKLVAAFLARHDVKEVAFTPYCPSYLDAGRPFPRVTPTDWYHPLPGWNIVSLSGLKVFNHPGWAEHARPVACIGRTHWAYYVK